MTARRTPRATVARRSTLARMADPVGVAEASVRLGVERRTMHKWQEPARNIMPPPDYPSVNGSKAWEWSTILKWAGATGHILSEATKAEYEARFGGSPVEPRKGGRLPGIAQKQTKVGRTRPAGAKKKPSKKSSFKEPAK